MSKLPFKLKQRKTACENSLFTVFFDHLVDAEKTLVEDYLVVEPKIKNENGISGVAILPVKDNRFGLVKVYRHPVAAYGWEVPRGFIDKNETARDAAKRELQEETGLICKMEDLEELATISPEPGIISAKIILYKANIKNSERIERENELGHFGFNWFYAEEVHELIKNNQLHDAMTFIAIHQYTG
jgi:ADP-ribose diphosphatase